MRRRDKFRCRSSRRGCKKFGRANGRSKFKRARPLPPLKQMIRKTRRRKRTSRLPPHKLAAPSRTGKIPHKALLRKILRSKAIRRAACSKISRNETTRKAIVRKPPRRILKLREISPQTKNRAPCRS